MQGSQDVGIKFGGREGVAGGNVSETHQGVHEGQLPWVIEFEPGDTFTARKHGGLDQVMQLTSVDKAFQNVLLNVKIIVANAGEPVSELWEIFDSLFDPIVGHVIGGRFGAQAQVIADILLNEAVCIVGANDWVRKVDIFDDRLKLSLVLLGDLTTEDRGDLVGLADGAIGIQQSLVEPIECGAPVKDQVVAILRLGEEEPVLTAASFAFAVFEERSQAG